jgi:hypothetical protein
MANEPLKTDNGVSSWLWLIPIILIIVGIVLWFRGCHEGSAEDSAKFYPIAANAQEFHLTVGVETPTVEAGLGTQHRIWANNPYKMRRVLSDGSEIFYPMPAGWETLTGVEPLGRVRLIGIEEKTVVKIVKVK